MPRFEPFRALRYDVGPDGGVAPSLAAVTAPPYAVLSDHDIDLLEQLHPYNIVHVDVPRERDGDGRYEAAGQRLREWIAAGVLVADPSERDRNRAAEARIRVGERREAERLDWVRFP